MKAIILAAGIGSRLRPITDKKPKTLVKVNDRPMLDYLINNLVDNDIKDIIICTGFKSEQIVNFCKDKYSDINFSFVYNKDFDTTNNMYSLYLAKDHFNDDIILMNADLVYGSNIIKNLLKQKESAVAVDVGNYIEESMKIIVENNVIKGISKKILEKDSYGSSIDVYKINKIDWDTIKDEMKNIIEEKKDLNQWTEVMLNNLFQTGRLIANPCNIKNEKWFEIDNYEDLAKAEIIFNYNIKNLKDKKIFFIDRDGTLTLGNNIIDGVIEFLDKLKNKNKIFYVLTNNSSKTAKEHLKKFNQIGFNLEEKNILVSIQPTLKYLQEHKIKKVFWVANKIVSSHLINEGFIFDDENPQAVLLTYDNEINYKKLEKLTHFVRKGIPYYVTHEDVVCPTVNGDIPDIGTFIKVIEMTTGILPNKVFGKPNRNFIDPTLREHNLTYNDAVVIGDRLYTDIKMAENSDITSVLVLSGETKREDYEDSRIRADIIVPNLKELNNLI